jgi:hypothetical protein
MATDIEINTTLPETEEEIEEGIDASIAWMTSDEAKEFAHYTEDHGLVDAMVEGKQVLALCGYLFIPYRDPTKFPVCPRCLKIKEHLDATKALEG